MAALSSEIRSSTKLVGIYVDRDRIHGCAMKRNVLGHFRIVHAEADLQSHDEFLETLQELLAKLGVDDANPSPLAVSIRTDLCYFATRPIASGSAKATPRALLRESLRSSTARLDDLSIDVIHWQPDRRTVAGIVAAPTDLVESIRNAVSQTPHSLLRLVPAGAALVSDAPAADRKDQRNALVTRVFLRDDSLLAAICQGELPIHWQTFPLPSGDESTGIVSSIRLLETGATACGLSRAPDSVVIHGRKELEVLVDREWLRKKLESSYEWIDGPTCDPESIALATARHLTADDSSFDLVRQHRDPLRLRRVFPYKELMAYLVAACVLAAVLWLRLGDVETQRTSMVSTAPKFLASGVNPKPEKDRLSARASAVTQFLDKRVAWSQVLSNVTRTLPREIHLTGIRAAAPMAIRRKKQVKEQPASLLLNARCELDKDGNIPEFMNSLADRVQAVEGISDYFSHVELSNLRQTEFKETGTPGTEFSIVLTNTSKARK